MRRMARAGVLSLLMLSVVGALGLAGEARPPLSKAQAQEAKPRKEKPSQQRAPAARQPQAAKARQRQPAKQGQRFAPRQGRQARPAPRQPQRPGQQTQWQNQYQRRGQSAPANRRGAPAEQRQGFRGRQRPQIRLARRNDRRIPDQHYRAYFGDQHRFRLDGLRMRGGYSAFQGGGYWFGFLQPWPGEWYDTDQFYIQDTGAGYILCDWYHRGPCVSIVVLQ